jgi:hypothetical protein
LSSSMTVVACLPLRFSTRPCNTATITLTRMIRRRQNENDVVFYNVFIKFLPICFKQICLQICM